MPEFDYQELIDDLKDEVGAGSLTKEELIQVLRDDQADANGYRPIIDWYYNDAALTIELSPDKEDSKEEIKDKLLLREQYQKDQPKLEAITVDACLAEMFEKTKKKPKKKGNPFF